MLELHVYKRVLIIRSEKCFISETSVFSGYSRSIFNKKITSVYLLKLDSSLVASYPMDPQLYF